MADSITSNDPDGQIPAGPSSSHLWLALWLMLAVPFATAGLMFTARSYGPDAAVLGAGCWVGLLHVTSRAH